MNLMARTAADGPQLRTILLTDLVDSTSLVERLGDVPASELFREHDRLVLKLQQHWHGRLIDRSDGLLLLFERPIDGLGFALDYTRGLGEMGKAHGLELRARAGLHVGEVLTWKNSEAAVLVGAKPLEVEGLAKPMAARMMTLARPGQILLSAMAEPLARRAARELGERGQSLLWKSHGRWCFKGIPESHEIFEVGEVGIAPMRAPPSMPKAWRDIPLWRRPAALAAELFLVAGLGLGVWFLMKPQPAIAFSERDWVVVGDMRNLTGQTVLDDSLAQAFRISLEQSRYVNVLSDMKTRDTLARMQRKPGTTLDRAIASEIAIRDGARAVILPTVSEVGGRMRVSAEVIDPTTQTTVYAESADGTGAESVLTSIDKVTSTLRGRLGEAFASIERDSEPLPQVTTSNLDALRAYALAQKAYSRGQLADALRLYERATQIDPQFALAWVGQMRSRFSAVDAPGAIKPLRQAQLLRNQLAPREAMYLDAWAAELEEPGSALGKWQELATLYPDFWPAQSNAGKWLYGQNRFKEAIAYAARNTSAQNELSALGFDLLGRSQLALEQYPAARQSLDQSLARGYDSSRRRIASVHAAQREFVAADKVLSGFPDDRYAQLERISVAIDQGDWAAAQSISKRALEEVAGETGYDSRLFLMPAAVADWLAGDKTNAMRKVNATATQALAALAQEFDADQVDDAGLALSAAMLAQRLGDYGLGAKVLSALGGKADLMAVQPLGEFAAIVRAGQARHEGRPQQALAILQPYLNGQERYQTRVALQEAHADLGEQRPAMLENARWLQARRGLAYSEFQCGYCLQALNVADSNIAILREAELLDKSGNKQQAEVAVQRFDRAWPTKALPDYLRVRRSVSSPESS